MSSRSACIVLGLLYAAPLAAAEPSSLFPLKTRLSVQQEGFVSALAFTPTGRVLVAGDTRGGLGYWVADSGKPERPWEQRADRVLSVACAPDGKFVAIGCGDGTIRFVDLADAKEFRLLRGHDDDVNSLAFSADGRLLLSGSNDQTVRVWDVNSGKELRKLLGHKSWVKSVALSADGKIAVSGARDQTARLWDVATGKQLRKMETEDSQVWAVALTPDGKTAVLGGGDGILRFWDVATGKTIRELLRPASVDDGGLNIYTSSPERIWALAFSPDGRTLASAGEGKAVRLWETLTGQPITTLSENYQGVMSMAFSPRGRELATGSESGEIRFWSLFPTGDESVSDRELLVLWNNLGSNFAGTAYGEMGRMMNAPRQTLSFLEGRLRPIPQVEEEALLKLIADLDSERFVVRQKAAQELERLAEVAEPVMRKALADKPSLELSRRLNDLLKPLETQTPAPERLRMLRALQVLEDIGSPEARRLLESLSRGAPEAQLTREAKAAVQRLSKRAERP